VSRSDQRDHARRAVGVGPRSDRDAAFRSPARLHAARLGQGIHGAVDDSSPALVTTRERDLLALQVGRHHQETVQLGDGIDARAVQERFPVGDRGDQGAHVFGDR
jgi:hypothetical protein